MTKTKIQNGSESIKNNGCRAAINWFAHAHSFKQTCYSFRCEAEEEKKRNPEKKKGI